MTDTSRAPRSGSSEPLCMMVASTVLTVTVGYGNVAARLHALFPGPALTSPKQTQHIATPISPAPPSRPFLKVRIVTWNMHESLPRVSPRSCSLRETSQPSESRATYRNSSVHFLNKPLRQCRSRILRVCLPYLRMPATLITSWSCTHVLFLMLMMKTEFETSSVQDRSVQQRQVRLLRKH